MRKIIFMAMMAVGFATNSMAQNDALVVEWNNGLADIYPVSTDLRIDNKTANDSIILLQNNKVLASYARADIKRIAFDTEDILTDSVERAALVAIYKATDGDNWKEHTNWCSDKPLSEWSNLYYSDNHVRDLYLQNNQLSGTIPMELFNLKKLYALEMFNNNLTDKLPAAIGRLNELHTLDLSNNQLTGDIPAEVGKLSNIREFWLYSNQFTGKIPAEFGELGNITHLDLCANQLTGSIPSTLGNLSNLVILRLNGNQLTGNIPAELGNLSNLNELDLCINKLEGEIPESFNNLKKLVVKYENDGYYDGIYYVFNINTWQNNLSGKVPSIFSQSPGWKDEWWNIMGGNPKYNWNEVYVPAPSFHVTGLDGEILDSKDFYPKNKYTAIFHWATWCGFSMALMNDVIPLYEKYHDEGFEVVGFSSGYDDTESAMREYISERGIKWHNFFSTESNMLDFTASCTGRGVGYPAGAPPEITLVDSDGRVVFSDVVNNRDDLAAFLKMNLGEGKNVDVYTSTDYSADGKTATLQTATSDKAIKVVLMGDGYTDRLIANGTYEKDMNKALEALFTTEPVKSYKDMFTVYSVTAVSENEVYTESTHTVFSGFFGDGMHVGGNDSKVFQYAQKVISPDDMDDAIIIVLMNSQKPAGTCWMYGPEKENSWGSGASVSYVPCFSGTIDDVLDFNTILTHEAIGHGFAKLGDEYVQKEETITAGEIQTYKEQEKLGWRKNVDFTSNQSEVKWSEFIGDDRYASEKIGVYQGGLTYRNGVYRPTPTSIMGSNAAEFNAPSRKAIWYRINKLTQGSGWEGSHQDFLDYDIAHPSTARSKARSMRTIKSSRRPAYKSAPPMILNKTWREQIKPSIYK